MTKFLNIRFLKRIFIYCLGFFILSIGTVLSIKSNLGVSPVNVIPYVLSVITGKGQGLLTTIVFTGFVLVQVVILRKDFKIINLLQIVFASLFGAFVTLSEHILFFETPESYILKLLLTVLSVIFVATGLMLYLAANILPQPAEGVTLALEAKSKISLAKWKIVFDCTVVVIAFILSLIFLKRVDGIREGTIIAAIFVGKLLGILLDKFTPVLHKFFGEVPEASCSVCAECE